MSVEAEKGSTWKRLRARDVRGGLALCVYTTQVSSSGAPVDWTDVRAMVGRDAWNCNQLCRTNDLTNEMGNRGKTAELTGSAASDLSRPERDLALFGRNIVLCEIN